MASWSPQSAVLIASCDDFWEQMQKRTSKQGSQEEVLFSRCTLLFFTWLQRLVPFHLDVCWLFYVSVQRLLLQKPSDTQSAACSSLIPMIAIPNNSTKWMFQTSFLRSYSSYFQRSMTTPTFRACCHGNKHCPYMQQT